MSTLCWGNPIGTSGCLPGGKAAGADHSLPSSAEVKNARSYTSTFPIRLHGVVLKNTRGQLCSGSLNADKRVPVLHGYEVRWKPGLAWMRWRR
jgi:hypothetical protein